MKIIIFAFLLLSLNGCASKGSEQKSGLEMLTPISKIQPSTAEEGTLANQPLIQDTIGGLEQVLSHDVSESEILMFVIQEPIGPVGRRAWRELWILKNQGAQFIMTFSEDGLGAANFEIRSM